MRSDPVLVFAHRGSSRAQPEHTLGAYLQAIEEGADGLECDVRLTRDGHLVCLHDRRLERTSNGRGTVSAHTLAELSELDFGSWHRGPTGPRGPGGGSGSHGDSGLDRGADLIYERVGDGPARVLTLDRLFNAAFDAGRPIRLLIETKHPTRYGAAVEHRLAAMLHRYGLLDPAPDARVRVTMMSFSALAVRRMRRLAPRLPTVMLIELLQPLLYRGRLPFGVTIGGPGIALLRARPELALRLRARGYPVYVWTVNEPDDLDLVLRLGVAGIITDRPGYLRRRLGELGRA